MGAARWIRGLGRGVLSLESIVSVVRKIDVESRNWRRGGMVMIDHESLIHRIFKPLDSKLMD